MPKILLCGNDTDLIDQLFEKEKDALMFMTTSENPEDIRRHLKSFIPKAFVFCSDNESDANLEKVGSVLEYVKAANASIILVGTDADLDKMFVKFGADKIQDTFSKELGVDTILEKMMMLDDYATATSTATPSNEIPLGSLESLEAVQATMAQAAPVKKVSDKKRILVVDDDANMLRALKLYLQEDFTVAVANSGQVALKFLEEKIVDLILLDYMMPTMDGPMTLKYIRNSVLTRKIPVIFLTGVSDRDKIREILGMNVQGYLLKPVEKDKLTEAINKAFGGGGDFGVK